MIKLILNKDAEHFLMVDNINYNITYKIQNQSNHSNIFRCKLNNDTIDNLSLFEDIPITSIDIYNLENTLLITLTFSNNNFYLFTSNINIIENDIVNYIDFRTIEQQEEII